MFAPIILIMKDFGLRLYTLFLTEKAVDELNESCKGKPYRAAVDKSHFAAETYEDESQRYCRYGGEHAYKLGYIGAVSDYFFIIFLFPYEKLHTKYSSDERAEQR